MIFKGKSEHNNISKHNAISATNILYLDNNIGQWANSTHYNNNLTLITRVYENNTLVGWLLIRLVEKKKKCFERR